MAKRAPMLRVNKPRQWGKRIWLFGLILIPILLVALGVWWFVHVNSGADLTLLRPANFLSAMQDAKKLEVHTGPEKHEVQLPGGSLDSLAPEQWQEVTLSGGLSRVSDQSVRFRAGSTQCEVRLFDGEQVVLISFGSYYRSYKAPGADYNTLSRLLQ